ncbi:LPXTG cell wall anchor domain-containing protein [Mesobacillus boroniphilus]|uniref:LPXTG cell wall anchor domain-containing protein n=1 Tax=Mesobacillus boroniphilus TaxID=308892 RepID=A0A944CNK7_9BACI|nr:LPXTG cell wall anchor domain-containing protein [Mesobacillus boroniphilus]MBS8266037.1 LPXTG cell wall anchor domain-containing protein [Mesobacillus boroniphilus]
MKIKKRLSLVAFMLMVMITSPVTGAFAAENNEQGAKFEENTSNQEEQVQKNNTETTKSADQKEKSNGEVKAASTENETNVEEGSDTKITSDQAQSNSDQETTNQPEESENSANQEVNTAEGIDAPEEESASEETNALEESNASEESNPPEEANASADENESTAAEDGTVTANENTSTQIHLHIDQCVDPVETAFVQVNGVWEEMTNPGSSPLYKTFDEGEFIKDNVTAFKLIFTTGEVLVVPVSEIRVGVEAEGSVNYWLESCELPAEEPAGSEDSEEVDETVNVLTMIKIMIDENPRQIEKVTLRMMSGKRIEFERVNALFSLTLMEEIELELIRGIEITRNGETKLILLSQIESLEMVDSVLTLQLNWEMEGEMVEEETGENESDGENDTTGPENNSGSGNTPDGTTNEQVWNGEVLPQTGESSRAMFYVLGFLIAAGGVMLRFKNPLKN